MSKRIISFIISLAFGGLLLARDVLSDSDPNDFLISASTEHQITAILGPRSRWRIGEVAEPDFPLTKGRAFEIWAEAGKRCYLYLVDGNELILNSRENVSVYLRNNPALRKPQMIANIVTASLLPRYSLVLSPDTKPSLKGELTSWLQGKEKSLETLELFFDQYPQYTNDPGGKWSLLFKIITHRGAILKVKVTGIEAPISIDSVKTVELMPEGSYTYSILN